jgi:hypothetical protein
VSDLFECGGVSHRNRLWIVEEIAVQVSHVVVLDDVFLFHFGPGLPLREWLENEDGAISSLIRQDLQ